MRKTTHSSDEPFFLYKRMVFVLVEYTMFPLNIGKPSSSLEKFAPVNWSGSSGSNTNYDIITLRSGEIRIEFSGGFTTRFSGIADSHAAMQLLTQICSTLFCLNDKLSITMYYTLFMQCCFKYLKNLGLYVFHCLSLHAKLKIESILIWFH